MPDPTLDVRAPDGHAWRMPGVPAANARAGLLWIPALGVPAEKYLRFAQALAERGITTRIHEWRGTATSSLRASRRSDWGYRELLEHDLPASHRAAREADPGIRWSIGGHSLGGQLAALHAARSREPLAAVALVATGVPDYRTFTGRQRWGVAVFAHGLPTLTRLVGHYPGERLGFAGREAGRLMRDWASTVRSGRYRGFGIGEDHEAALRALDVPVLGLRMAHDWLAPERSLRALLDKIGHRPAGLQTIDDSELGDRADHFRWLRMPAAVAERVAGFLPT